MQCNDAEVHMSTVLTFAVSASQCQQQMVQRTFRQWQLAKKNTIRRNHQDDIHCNIATRI